MQKIIEKIENMEISVAGWLATFWGINVLRMTLESFSGNGLSLYPFEAIFIHPPLFYAVVLLSVTIILRVATKVAVPKILKIVIFGFFAFLIPPFVDFIISGGKGDLQIQYLFSPLPQLLKDFVTFLGPNLRSGATYGIRVEALTTMVFVGLYIYVKTKKPLRVALGVLASYVVAFVFGALPGIVGSLSYFPKNPWIVSQIEILQRFIIPRDIFALHFGPIDIQRLYSTEMAWIFLPIVTVLLLVVFYLWDKTKFLGFMKKFRYLRLLFHYGALAGGILIGWQTYNTSWHVGGYHILSLFALLLSVTCIWAFSLTINDRNDVAIDKISNQDRLLVRGIFTPKEFDSIALISFVLALVASYSLGYNFFILVLASLIFSYLYSCYPARLRRFPFIAPFMMSLGTTFIVLMGFLLFSPSGTFADFPITFFMLMVFVVALVSNIKDIKDISGDSQNGVYTIPTLFGDKRGKIIIALLFVLSYLLFPIILRTQSLIITSIIFSVFTWLLINSKKVSEQFVFAVYALFLVVVAFTVFS